MRRLIAVAALLLASCQPPAATTRDVADTADANGRQALVEVGELRTAVEKRDAEIAALKTQATMYETRIAALEEAHENLRKKHNLLNDAWTKEAIEETRRLSAIEQRLGIR